MAEEMQTTERVIRIHSPGGPDVLRLEAVPVERRYALAEAALAHRELEARLTTGCRVLIP